MKLSWTVVISHVERYAFDSETAPFTLTEQFHKSLASFEGDSKDASCQVSLRNNDAQISLTAY